MCVCLGRVEGGGRGGGHRIIQHVGRLVLFEQFLGYIIPSINLKEPNPYYRIHSKAIRFLSRNVKTADFCTAPEDSQPNYQLINRCNRIGVFIFVCCFTCMRNTINMTSIAEYHLMQQTCVYIAKRKNSGIRNNSRKSLTTVAMISYIPEWIIFSL